MPDKHSINYRILDWDSELFGFPVASIHAHNRDSNNLDQSLHQLQQLGVRLVYLESEETLEFATFKSIDESDAVLVDTRCTFELTLDCARKQDIYHASPPVEELPKTKLTPTLADLAILAGKYSRFNLDNRIPDDKFRELYSIWMEKSIKREIADSVLVARDKKGSIAGVITLSISDEYGSIGLVAVKPESQGQGLGAALVQSAKAYFVSQRCRKTTVITQQRNKPACKLYSRFGFRLTSSMIHYHIWL